MSAWRLLIEDGVGGVAGLATDDALMLHYGREDAATPWEATLRLYTYRAHSVNVGRYQMLAAEVDTAACRRLGIDVARRPTGGGAIIMGPRQLGIAITTRAPADLHPGQVLRRYGQRILVGLRSLGVDARLRGKNDLEVGARKIAGLGLYADDRGALLFHASVLAGIDIPLMLSVLRIPGAKLADKGITRVQERLTTVSRELGRELNGVDLRDAIAAGFQQTLGVSLQRAELDTAERARATELSELYGSTEWLADRQVEGDTRGDSLLRTPSGLIRIYTGLQGTALSSVMLTGDYSTPPPALLSLEAALRWCSADPQRILEITRRELAADGGLLGSSADAVAAAIWQAARGALSEVPA